MLNDKVALQKAVDEKPLRLVAEDLGVPYSRVQTAVKKLGVAVPQRQGLVFTEESRKRKSESQKAAYKKKYPNGRFGELHPGWKGGRTISPKGYIWVYKPDHHRASNGRVFEHILVAEEKLGRPVLRSEIVHHINGDRQDNRPENLEVMSRSDHQKSHMTKGETIQYQLQRIEYLEALLKANNIDYT